MCASVCLKLKLDISPKNRSELTVFRTDADTGYSVGAAIESFQISQIGIRPTKKG